MADEADIASDREELDRSLAIMAARKPMMLATGECHNCGASVPSGAKFCDVDCRDDWERRNSMRRSCSR